VTGAYRINYATLGNSLAVLHTHIVPRYLSEPETLRLGGPWSYPQKQIDALRFDAERDRELMRRWPRQSRNACEGQASGPFRRLDYKNLGLKDSLRKVCYRSFNLPKGRKPGTHAPLMPTNAYNERLGMIY